MEEGAHEHITMDDNGEEGLTGYIMVREMKLS